VQIRFNYIFSTATKIIAAKICPKCVCADNVPQTPYMECGRCGAGRGDMGGVSNGREMGEEYREWERRRGKKR